LDLYDVFHAQVAPGVHKIGARLEELAPGARVAGVVVGHEVTVIDVRWPKIIVFTEHREILRARTAPSGT